MQKIFRQLLLVTVVIISVITINQVLLPMPRTTDCTQCADWPGAEAWLSDYCTRTYNAEYSVLMELRQCNCVWDDPVWTNCHCWWLGACVVNSDPIFLVFMFASECLYCWS